MASPDEPGPGPLFESNLQSCLELLKGPGDDKRFAGLLLVVQLLPRANDVALRRVLEALGSTFLDRLLLPLTRQRQDPQGVPASDEAYQQEVLSCSLALAILSSACRIPELAAGLEMQERIPMLVKVVKAGGVPNIIAKPAAAAGKPVELVIDGQAFSTAATVSDALECLVSIAGCGSKQACGAVLSAGGLEAAAKALAAAAGSAASGASKGAAEAAAAAAAAAPAAPALGEGVSAAAAVESGPLAQPEVRHTAMLAVRLVGLLLECGPASKLSVLADYTDVLQHTVAALGMLVGHPSVLAQQQQQQQAVADGDGVGGHQDDAAMLQLEALHALLLILPLPQELELHHRLAGAVHRQEWPAAVRRGLNWLLRSRISAVQKHSALQLAAALVELAGPAWLLARGEQRPEAFLQVLAETLHVETALLLHDALYPDQLVREETLRSDTRQHWQGPQVSEPFLQGLRDQAAAREAAAAKQVAAAVAAASGSAQPDEVAGSAAGPDVEMEEVAAPAAPAPAAAAPATVHQHAAGERAARLLPCCYLLLESIIEVLAADSAMQEDDMMVIDEAGESEEEEEEEQLGLRQKSSKLNFWEGSRRGMPPQRQGQQLLQPGVSQKAAQQLMYNLETTVSVMLQFMDELQEQGGGAGAGAAAGAGAGGGTGAGSRWAGVQADLALGAVRVLGRFLAEAPEAHTEEFRKALPFMLRIGTAGRGISLSPSVPSADSGAGAGVTGAGPVQFLLPGLLQATSESSTPATQLRRALCKSPAALTALGAFLEAAADEAAQLAASLQAAIATAAAAAAPGGAVAAAAAAAAGGTPGGASGVAGSGASGTSSGALSRAGSVGWITSGGSAPVGRALRMAELGRVERLMADVSALLLNVLDAKDLSAMAAVGRSLSASGRGQRSFGSASSSSLAAASAAVAAVTAEHAAELHQQASQPAAALLPHPPVPQQHLGPVTRALLPAVASLGRWWRARSVWCPTEADLVQPQRVVEQLAGARLMPRTVVCCGTLAGAVLEAASKQLSALATAATGSAAAGEAAAAAAGPPTPLPPADLQPVVDLVVQALQSGCCLSLTMMETEEEVGEDAAREAAAAAFAASMVGSMVAVGISSSSHSSSSVSSSGSSTPHSPRSLRDPMLLAPSAALAAGGGVFSSSGKGSKGGGASGKLMRTSTGGGPDTSMVVDDFPGDAEHAWERLGHSLVSLVDLLAPLQQAVRGAGWVKQLLGAAAAAGGVQSMTMPAKRSASSVAAAAAAAAAASVVAQQQQQQQQAPGVDSAAGVLGTSVSSDGGPSGTPSAVASFMALNAGAAAAQARQQELLLQVVGLRMLLATVEAMGLQQQQQ